MNGITITDFSGGDSQARSVAIDASGRIVVAGFTSGGVGESDFALARYLPTGKLDLSFGATGKVITTIGIVSHGISVAIDNSGRIVVAGDNRNLSGYYIFALVRYTDTGQLDLSFGGKGTGIVTSNFGVDSICRSVAIDKSNRIVVAGYTYLNNQNNFVVACYTNDGVLDNTFGTQGKTTTIFGGFLNNANSMAIDMSGGRIVLAGFTDASGGQNDFAVACYLPNGQPDLSFGTDGKVMTNFGANSSDAAMSVAIDASGRIVVAGSTNVSGGQVDFALARYLADGQPDVSFGTQGTGKVITDIGGTGTEDMANSIKIDASGRIVVAGYTDVGGNGNQFALVRYLPNGQPDTFFGPTPGGKVITDIDGSNEAYSLAIDSSGRIIVAGSNNFTTGLNFAVACFTDTGFLDESFGDEYESITVSELAYSVAIDPSGRIVVAGYSNDSRGRNNFALARYTADMALDLSFGTNGTGKVSTDFSGNDIARGLAIDASGRIVVSGFTTVSGGASMALARYLPNGVLDASFGSNNTGKVITDFSGNNAGSYSVVIDPSGRIVVAGLTGSGNLIDNPYDAIQHDFALARYLPNGVLDLSFGTNGTGKIATDFSGNSNDFASSVAIDSSGRIVVAGTTNVSNGQYDFALVRYLPDGKLDASFGKVITDFGGLETIVSITIDANDRIVAAGITSTNLSGGNSKIALARYLSNGQLDVSFGTQGKVIAGFSNDSAAANITQGVVIDPSNRIVVVGSTISNVSGATIDFGVARFTSAGILDTTFGNQGAITTDFGKSNDFANGVAIDRSGRIVVVGSTDVSGSEYKYGFALARYTTTGALDKTFPASFTYKFLRDFSIISNNLSSFIQDNRTAIEAFNISTVGINFTASAGSILVLVTGPETQITQIQNLVINGQLYVPIGGVLTQAVLPSVSEQPPNNIYICFKEGTRILTNTGYVPVETLVPGQLIQTFRHGLVPMRALGRSRVSNVGGRAPRSKNRLYMYRRGCLDGKKPFADLVVTGEHSALVPSLQYVEKNFMIRHFGSAKTTDDQFHLLAQYDARAVPYEPRGVFTVYHFALACGRDYERHYGVYANGMLMESCSVNHLKALASAF